jgi:hypothetical protein
MNSEKYVPRRTRSPGQFPGTKSNARASISRKRQKSIDFSPEKWDRKVIRSLTHLDPTIVLPLQGEHNGFTSPDPIFPVISDMELAGVPGRIPLYSPRKSPLSHGSKEIQH